MIRTTTRVRRRAAATALVVILSVLLAGACGSSSSGGSGKPSGQNAQADDSDRQVKFNTCLREHGLNITESKPGEQKSMTLDGGDGEKLKAAMDACRSLAPNGGKPAELSQADKDAALGFARCMRKNGVEMPDPVFDGNFAQAMPAAKPGPEADRFAKANTICSKEFPQSGQSGRTGAGQ